MADQQVRGSAVNAAMTKLRSDKIAFSCVHCGKRYCVSAELAGRAVKCYGCNGAMTVPPIRPATAVESTTSAVTDWRRFANPPQAPPRRESDFQKPPPEQITECQTCGSPMRQVRSAGKATQKTLCLTCSPTNGRCPLCGGVLRTPQAQQCLHCKVSWHSTVGATANLSANETKPVEDDDAVRDNDEVAWEVILPDGGIRRITRIEEVRELLMSGTLNRSSYCRSVRARPDGNASDSEQAEWKSSRRFRQIGATLAETEFEILSLYDPEQAHAGVAANAGAGMGAVAAIAVGLVLGIAGGAWQATVGGLLVLVALAMLGATGAEGVGAAIGGFLVCCIGAGIVFVFGENARLPMIAVCGPVFWSILRAGNGKSCLGMIALLAGCGGIALFSEAADGTGWIWLWTIIGAFVSAAVGGAIGYFAGREKGAFERTCGNYLPTTPMVGPTEIAESMLPSVSTMRSS